MTWQPIETAPKDGTAALIFSKDDAFGPVIVGWWENDDEAWWGPHSYIVRPTHWMPLPDPPKEDQ